MLPLDADSLMAGDAIVRLVRVMQAHPRLGILQSLVVGAPAESAFARIFQFGMRHGMRTYTMGSAWWIGDCGPFWGHNAVVRIAPFRDHCDLPILPGKPPLGGHVLSHDQVEATLMRRAGYEVRVLPEEGGSWEDNPPTIFQFSARDLRWCQGNMQYLRLLGTAGPPADEPLPARLGDPDVPRRAGDDADDRARSAEDPRRRGPLDLPGRARDRALSDLPRHVSLAEARRARRHPAREGRRRALRRLARFLASAAIEIVFSFLLGAVTTFRITLFMIGLLFGRSVIWNGQARDAHGVSWSDAVAGLWPASLFGALVCGALGGALAGDARLEPAADARLSRRDPLRGLDGVAEDVAELLERHALCGIPEELEPPAEIRALQG